MVINQIAGIQQYGRSIPFAYLRFLETMGQNDNGLLAQEWDGGIEANIDSVIEDYACYIDLYEIDRSEYLLFCTHWTESALFLKLATGENPPVYHYGKLFLAPLKNIYSRWHSAKWSAHDFHMKLIFPPPPRHLRIFSVLQKMKKSLTQLFGEIANWSDQYM